MTDKTQYYPALTGLRMIAASFIFFHHYWKVLGSKFILSGLFREGHIAVVFFFVLSGTLTALHHAKMTKDKESVLKFWNARIKRIFPLYLIVTVPLLLKQNLNPLGWLINLTLIKGWLPNAYFSGNAPAWALTVELSFYLFAPFLILTWHKTPLWQKVMTSISIAAISTCIFNRSFNLFSTDHFILIYTLLGRSFEFIIGMWLGFKLLTTPSKQSFQMKTVGGLVAASMSIFALILLQQQTPGSIGLFHPVGFIVNNYLLASSIMLFVWGLCTEKTRIRAFLESKIMVLLGESSYAFFLIHFTKYVAPIRFFADSNIWVVFILLWIVSIVIHQYIEKPMLKLIS